ncbi:condensation domain-containing protein [Streptomyces sp. INA 01156]
MQHWLFDSAAERAGHFGQTLSVKLHAGVDARALEDALNDVIAHHDALRSRFLTDAAGVRWLIDGRTPAAASRATPVRTPTPAPRPP